MADAVTSQTLADGDRTAVMKFTNISDGNGEASVVKVDVSALSGAPSKVTIDQIWYDIGGMRVLLDFDASTNVPALVLGGSAAAGNDQGHWDYRSFGGIKNNAGANSFSLTPKRWIEATNAKGIISKTGRYGGTFAHRDIAFEFATWLSAEFKFYLIKEFQRLKQEESESQHLDWNLQRTIAKINYRIHTDAIKENIIPTLVNHNQLNMVYANEADLLNVALFGVTAKEWRGNNPAHKGNIRDEASLEQLVVLSNLESINALLVNQGLEQSINDRPGGEGFVFNTPNAVTNSRGL